MSDDQKKWDLKQVGTGVGGSFLALMLLQDRGIDFMNKHQESSNQVVIEKTVANAQRINQLERTVDDVNDKLDRGFDSLRNQIRDDVNRLSSIISTAASDRYTKTEHNSYRKSIESRIQRIEDDIKKLRRE